MIQIVTLFNLETTALEYFLFSLYTTHEGGMFDVELMEHLQAGDVLLGDRLYGFCLHFTALAGRGVDVLTHLFGSNAWPKGARGDDVTVQWKTATRKCPPTTYHAGRVGSASGHDHRALYEYRINISGFRTRHILVTTTLRKYRPRNWRNCTCDAGISSCASMISKRPWGWILSVPSLRPWR